MTIPSPTAIMWDKNNKKKIKIQQIKENCQILTKIFTFWFKIR